MNLTDNLLANVPVISDGGRVKATIRNTVPVGSIAMSEYPADCTRSVEVYYADSPGEVTLKLHVVVDAELIKGFSHIHQRDANTLGVDVDYGFSLMIKK